jgi:hypothetical protein
MIQASFMLQGHNPDVLTCIANLSNDEVFTPPELTNQMLDTLESSWAESNNGESIWANKDVTFLDPCTKSGVFLREIVRRLNEGLAVDIPELDERINHILTKQVFGIGITQLTSLLARRSVYCSRNANSVHSIGRTFTSDVGNIWFERTEHVWVDGKCKFCSVSKAEYGRGTDLETYAYKFIHSEKIKGLAYELFGNKMQFDVVIGNPPYQLSVGNTSGNSSKARSIYHEFISQAIALEPRFISMVIPSRWMTRSAEGIPDTWIDEFIEDKRIRVLHDYLDSKLCFPNVSIEGGVCYFLWNRDFEGKCEYQLHDGREAKDVIVNVDYLNSKGIGIVVRDVKALTILEKIEKIEGDWLKNSSKNFSSIVSPKDFFTNKEKLTSSWTGFKVKKDANHDVKYFLNKSMHKIQFGYVKIKDVPKNSEVAKWHKVYIPAARGLSVSSTGDVVLGTPFYGERNSVCSQTYLVIGFDQSRHKLTKIECENMISYISTKFFRYLVSLKKRTQNGPRGVYQFVPLQDFSVPWTDEKLYKKYGLSKDEVAFIESRIRPMELDGE